MDEIDRDLMASKNWDETALKKKANKNARTVQKSQHSSISKRLRNSAAGGKHLQSVDSIDYDLSSSDDEKAVNVRDDISDNM